VPVVADGDPETPYGCVVDRCAGVSGRVVSLLVEVLIRRNVHHAGSPEQGAVGVDDGRGVERVVPVALHQVEDDDQAELRRRFGHRLRRGPRYRLGKIEDRRCPIRHRKTGIEGGKRQLRKHNEVRAGLGGFLQRPVAPLLSIVGRLWTSGRLHQRDVHG